MKTFQFSLESVRRLRAAEEESENGKLQTLIEQMRQIENMIAANAELRSNAGRSFRKQAWAEAPDCHALVSYTRYLEAENKALVQKLSVVAKATDDQRSRVLAARRRCKVFDRLRAEHLTAWQRDFSLEVESDAATAYLAKWDGAAEA